LTGPSGVRLLKVFCFEYHYDATVAGALRATHHNRGPVEAFVLH
jgi:hypothetical protein